jgi:hypothetical protein
MDKDAGEWGRYNGEEVANKDTVLGELDRLLNKGEPPDLELIFILPFPVPPSLPFYSITMLLCSHDVVARTGRCLVSRWRTPTPSDT